MIKKFIGIVLTIAIIFSGSQQSFAAATQEDVDYSTQVSEKVIAFAADASAWATVVSDAPTLAVGSKYKTYKTKSSKASDKFIATIKVMKGLKASPGFATSGPLLINAMGLYEKAILALKAAINKNDVKAIGKASQLASKANTAYLAWQKAYTAEVAALNG